MFKKISTLMLCIIALTSFVAADSLGDVNIQFCNNGSGGIQQSGVTISGDILYYKLGVEQKGDICYTVNNISNKDIVLKVSFVDGTFTNDERRNKACLSDTDIEDFGQYVTGYEQILALSGFQTIQKSGNFTYPVGSDGIYHGCLVYSILEKKEPTTGQLSNFAVLMRRARFIDVLVGDLANASKNAITLLDFNSASGENLSKNPKIRLYIDPTDSKYVVQFELKNISRFDQDVMITGVISNFLLYKKNFSEPRRMLRGDTLLVTKKFDEVPPYNLNLKLDFASKIYDTFGNEESEAVHMSERTNIWIIDTVFIVSVIGFILFFIIAYLLLMVLKNQRKEAKKAKISNKDNE